MIYIPLRCGGINTINTVVQKRTDVTANLKSKQLLLFAFAGKDANTFNALINIDYCRGIHIKIKIRPVKIKLILQRYTCIYVIDLPRS